MLFLVISNPRPERSSEVAASRQKFWPWMREHQQSGKCRHIYPRVGRGVICVFDIDSNTELHQILNEWADIVPASFDTYPLVDVAASNALITAQLNASLAPAE